MGKEYSTSERVCRAEFSLGHPKMFLFGSELEVREEEDIGSGTGVRVLCFHGRENAG